MSAAVDFTKLEPRIAELVKKYKPMGQVKIEKNLWNIPHGDRPHYMSIDLHQIIRSMIYLNNAKQKSYWSKYGIRMENSPEFLKCKADVAKKSKPIGQGAYGSVFSAPALPCMDLPKGVTRVAIKFENLRLGWGLGGSQSPQRVKEATVIANKASKLGIGPKLYDTFVILDKGSVIIVRIYELLDGKSWNATVWTPAKKAAAVKILDRKVRKMNAAGIIHNDLHTNNVMVTKSNDVFIIDFDLSALVKTVETRDGTLSTFNVSLHGLDLVPDELVDFVYDGLIADGSLVLT